MPEFETHPVMFCGKPVDVCEAVEKPLDKMRCARCGAFIWLHDPYEWTRVKRNLIPIRPDKRQARPPRGKKPQARPKETKPMPETDKKTRALEKDDPGFVKSFKYGAPAPWMLGRHFQDTYNIFIPKRRLRATVKERHAYADQGDLYLTGDGKQKRVEVRRVKDWTEDDYPFDDVCVMKKRIFDTAADPEKPGKPVWAMILVNHEMTRFAQIDPVTTFEFWTFKMWSYGVDRKKSNCYFVRRDLLTYHTLTTS